jgi:hypothetical protein
MHRFILSFIHFHMPKLNFIVLEQKFMVVLYEISTVTSLYYVGIVFPWLSIISYNPIYFSAG